MADKRKRSLCGLWNVADQTRIGEFALDPDWRQLSISPRGDRLAAAYRGKTVLWDLLERRIVSVLPGLSGYWHVVAFSPDGAYLAVTAENELPEYRFKIWDMRTLRETATMAHQNHLTGLAFSPDGKTLASSSLDGTARLWDVPSGREVLVLRGHKDFVRYVDWSPDGRTLLTCGDDRALRLWHVSTGRALISLGTAFDEPSDFAVFSPCGDSIVSGYRTSGHLSLFSASGGDELTATSPSLAGKQAWLSNWERLREVCRLNLLRGEQ